VSKRSGAHNGTVAITIPAPAARVGVRRSAAVLPGFRAWVELTDAEVCCGFGGLFATKYGELSNAIVARKADDIVASRPTRCGGDLGCLMNMAANFSRGSTVKARHIARNSGRHGDDGDRRRQTGGRPMRGSRPRPNAKKTRMTRCRRQNCRARCHFRATFVGRRAAAAARLPERALRQRQAIKDHTLAHSTFISRPTKRRFARRRRGHYRTDAEKPRKIIIELCQSMGAKSVTKGKSMIAEEINLNHALEGRDRAIETDLGEYIIIARRALPQFIAPAIHLTGKTSSRIRRRTAILLPERSLAEPEQLLAEARSSAQSGRRRRHNGANFSSPDRNVDISPRRATAT